MSQLLTVMLIGRQAFLILMAMEAKHLQSVSHDILPAGKSPLLEKSAFLRNPCPLGSCLAGPRPKVHGEVGQGRADVVAVDSVSCQGRLSQLCSTSATGQLSGLVLSWEEQRDARDEAPAPRRVEYHQRTQIYMCVQVQ